VDIKQIREELGLSQSEFARRYGLNLRSLQEWEQGRRQPESAVRAYLIVIRQDPSAVAAALKATA
jgi:putative transcriptional regulator